MRLKKIKLLLFFLIINCSFVFSQEFPTYNFDEFEPLMHKQGEKVYVINFWATWCRPCVKEMPAFNQLYDKYHDKNVEMILVNLDFGESVPIRVKLFKDQHNIKSKIVILDDPDTNSWIDRVNPDWSGAIPATLIYNKNRREFYEQSFDFKELEDEVKKFL